MEPIKRDGNIILSNHLLMPSHSAYTVSQKLALINKARDVLRGEYMESSDLKKLLKELEVNDQFAYATEILLRKMKEDEEQKISVTAKDYQTLAKYIYKDTSLPSSFKFEKALQQLHSHLNLDETGNCETLGLAGAVYKRKWQYDHRFKNLVLSRYYYKQGYIHWRAFINEKNKDEKDVRNDSGFTAINYAYMCELMATDKLEEWGNDTGFTAKISEDLEEAVAARTFILNYFIELDKKDWLYYLKRRVARFFVGETKASYPKVNKNKWAVATVAEACFGLGLYKEAKLFIRQFLADTTSQPWEIRTFNQQLLSIAYLQILRKKWYNDFKVRQQARELKEGTDIADIDYSNISGLQKHVSYVNDKESNECLQLFKECDGTASTDVYNDEENRNNKWGLALSGGGFRASLFHIGVLAALAEEDQLKHIEVLSCVSGGSIIGAYYYLKIKLLFENKEDGEIDKQDYINLIKEIETDFLQGVQKNLRMRIFSNLFLNIKIIFSKHYSRTHRLGELYEKYLFTKILKDKNIFNEEDRYSNLLKRNKGKIFMSDLFINPKLRPGEQFNFNTDNWLRKNKIPQLILNATSVNTGHNWQFTASYMGEPAGSIEPDIDVKPRLRRMYYEDAPSRYKQFRLGYAVGASSCVPVMFHPMPMFDLYPGIDLQLIDGGLNDNQGIRSLLETECVNMIISDASGQLPTGNAAINNEAALFFRADNILQERLRELQFKDVIEREATTQINTLINLHLKNGLQQEPISWLYCADPPRTIYDINSNSETDLTKYGVLRNVQFRLSEIRTDLDSFSNTEAYALMYSGWSQTRLRFHPNLNMDENAHTQTGWKFLGIKPFVTDMEKAAAIDGLLKAGKYLPFKLWYVSKFIRYFLIFLLLISVAVIIFYTVTHWNEKLSVSASVTVKGIAWMVAIYVIGVFSKLLANLLDYKGYVWKKILDVIIAVAGFLICWIYVVVFNPIYNKIGKLNK